MKKNKSGCNAWLPIDVISYLNTIEEEMGITDHTAKMKEMVRHAQFGREVGRKVQSIFTEPKKRKPVMDLWGNL